MNTHKKDITRVRHMLDAIELLNKHLSSATEDNFLRDDLLNNLAARQISIVGEAMGNLSQEFRIQYPDLPYQDAKKMRNFLIHEYFDVTNRIVWETYRDDIPALKAHLEAIPLD